MTNNKLVCPETDRGAQKYMGRQRLLYVVPALTLKKLYAQPTQCINLLEPEFYI